MTKYSLKYEIDRTGKTDVRKTEAHVPMLQELRQANSDNLKPLVREGGETKEFQYGVTTDIVVTDESTSTQKILTFKRGLLVNVE